LICGSQTSFAKRFIQFSVELLRDDHLVGHNPPELKEWNFMTCPGLNASGEEKKKFAG
jgi:hypothetical protein